MNNWLLYHICSGHVFFTGVALVVIGVIAAPRVPRLSGLAFSIGAIGITISSAAIPYWWYAVALIVTSAWLASRFVTSWRRWTPVAVIVVWVIAAGLELPYHITPKLGLAPDRTMTIIGDSVTAGVGQDDESEKWPAIVSHQHGVVVQDISQMGETAESALKRARKHSIVGPVVLLEIGGNDLLGSRSAAQFERSLDALLAYVSAPDRRLVMFELPLPPFCHEYGRIQRSLARKHGVSLVPKRVFLSVLLAGEATLDSIHLSQVGHERMAASVWKVVSPAYEGVDPMIRGM